MSTVVLINPPQTQLLLPRAYISLGLASIAAVLEESGVDVEILNLADCRDVEGVEIPESEWYGISCVSATLPATKKLVSLLRGKGKTVVGGVHPSVAPEETRLEINPDVVMSGEAEHLFRDLVTGVVEPEPIMHAGLIQKLDGLPFPARHMFDREDVVDTTGIHGQEKGVPATTIMTSRGCPYSCNFCTKGHPMFNWYRYRSADKVYDELVHLKEEYAVEHMRFVDDEFTLHTQRTADLMRKMKPLGLTWICITRVDTLDKPLLKLMKGAKCKEVHVGVETGSDRLLRLMNKQTTSDILLKGIHRIKEAGIRVKTYLMANYPGETEEDRRLTVEWMKKAKPDKLTLSNFTPLPGSAIAVYIKQKGDGWFYPDEDKAFIEYRDRLKEASNC